jgi:uncharacterized LabA/DUF88 family protein
MSTYGTYPHPRIAIFVDGWNFKYATYDAFGIQVDFIKLLNYLSEGSILIRAYYYTGEWTVETIDQYVKLTASSNSETLREDLENQRRRSQSFYRFLNRNGYMVVLKPLKVFAGGTIKADLDLELAIDMFSLVDRCDKFILERAAWIDVLGCFLNLAFVGIYQWVFGHFPRKLFFASTFCRKLQVKNAECCTMHFP